MDRIARFGPYLKAIVSALVSGAIAFLSSLLTALQGEHTGFETITDGQWVTAVLAFLIGLGVGGGVTHQVRNRPAPPPAEGSPDPASTRREEPPEAHRTDVHVTAGP